MTDERTKLDTRTRIVIQQFSFSMSLVTYIVNTIHMKKDAYNIKLFFKFVPSFSLLKHRVTMVYPSRSILNQNYD